MSTASPRPSQAVLSPGRGTLVHHTTLSPINTPPPRGTRELPSSQLSTTSPSTSSLKPARSGLVEKDTAAAAALQRPPALPATTATATATNLLLAAHHPALLLLLLPVVVLAVIKTTLASSSSPATTKSVSWWAVNLFSSMPTLPWSLHLAAYYSTTAP